MEPLEAKGTDEQLTSSQSSPSQDISKETCAALKALENSTLQAQSSNNALTAKKVENLNEPKSSEAQVNDQTIPLSNKTSEEFDALSYNLIEFCRSNRIFEKEFKETYRELINKGASEKALMFLDPASRSDLFDIFQKNEMTHELVTLLNQDEDLSLPDNLWRDINEAKNNDLVNTILQDGSDKLIRKLAAQIKDPIQCFKRLDLGPNQAILYKKTLELGHSPSREEIEMAFHRLNYLVLEVIFSSIEIKQCVTLLKYLEKAEDAVINSIFTKALKEKGISDFGNQITDEELSKAIREGRTELVKWAFENKKQVKDIEKHLNEALSIHNLPMIRILFNYGRDNQKLKQKNYLEILGFDKNYKKGDEDLLFAYAINSPIADINLIVGAFPYLKDHITSILRQIALIVRFPVYCKVNIDPKSHVTTHKRGAISIQEDKDYATKNLKTVDEMVSKIHKLTHEQMLTEIIQHRFKDFNLNDKDYITKTGRFGYVTSLFLPTWPNRYWHSLKHLMRLVYSSSNKTSFSTSYPSLKVGGPKKGFDFDFYYINEQGDSIAKISAFQDFENWSHPNEKEIGKLSNTLEKLHQELLDKNLARATFYEKIARYYYIMATISEYNRGTPHNVMIALNIFYAYHKLSPPIPKLNHFFLDNTMLMLPQEEVIAKWTTFFEAV